ncbi:MAG: hypothetical protein WBN15_17475, partial [Polyangiales bacterium]
MGAEQDSLEQKLPASVVKALQLFMERSFWNKWAEVTETHLQAPAQQFNSSTPTVRPRFHAQARV